MNILIGAPQRRGAAPGASYTTRSVAFIRLSVRFLPEMFIKIVLLKEIEDLNRAEIS
jgi:hypothetical protein